MVEVFEIIDLSSINTRENICKILNDDFFFSLYSQGNTYLTGILIAPGTTPCSVSSSGSRTSINIEPFF